MAEKVQSDEIELGGKGWVPYEGWNGAGYMDKSTKGDEKLTQKERASTF